MLIALTGTPGVGKTQCAAILGKKGHRIVDLNEMAISNDFIDGYDEERDSHIIDVQALDGFVQEEFRGSDVVFEGHLSHLLSVEMAVILRCNPLELKRRLTTKGWSECKILENVQAEILDVVKVEAHDRLERVYEIDTTGRNPKEVAELFEAIVSGKSNGDETAWLEDYDYLLLE
jgi:adenylate kinase